MKFVGNAVPSFPAGLSPSAANDLVDKAYVDEWGIIGSYSSSVISNATTTFANALTAQPVSTGTYKIDASGIYQCNNTTSSIGIAINGPTATSIIYYLQTQCAAALDQRTATTYDGIGNTSVATATTNQGFHLTGYIVITSVSTPFALRYRTANIATTVSLRQYGLTIQKVA